MKRKPRRLPTEKGAFVAKRAWQKPAQKGLVQPEGPAPCGVHQLVPADGDPASALEGRVGPRQRGAHGLKWEAKCVKCGAGKVGSHKWLALGLSVCPDEEGGHVALRWVKTTHELVPHSHGLRCVRCQLTCPMATRERTAAARCPVWALVDAAGGERRDAMEWAAWNAGLPVRFAASAGVRVRGREKRVVPVEPALERPAKRPCPARAFLAPYESHVRVSGGRFSCCLKCGKAWGAGRSGGDVCGGYVEELPAMVAMLMTAGAFDEGLSEGPALVRELAGRRGWAAGRPYEPAGPPD